MTLILRPGDALTVAEESDVPNQYGGLVIHNGQAWQMTAKLIPWKYPWTQNGRDPVLLFDEEGQLVPHVTQVSSGEKGLIALTADLTPGRYVRMRLHPRHWRIICYLFEMTADGVVVMKPKIEIARAVAAIPDPSKWETELPWLESFLREFAYRGGLPVPGTDITIAAL
jgi:hypothetical protein